LQQPIIIGDFENKELNNLINKYHFKLKILADHETIPASFWGDPEAGLIGKTIFVKKITPLHSFFHEFSHLICMTENRRISLTKDAKSDDEEESAVCYLQILLADYLIGVNPNLLMKDMDDWGYSFRLGSTQAWFQNDSCDSRKWLQKENILDEKGSITWVLRT
tara:strand:- start:150 stop:641 length:492 start_codon:yes stop_codon:yes gene_type:complete